LGYNDSYGLGEVDGRVLQMMASSADTSFSFQGIKRSLQVHQEKLSRSLNRLSSQGLVGKFESGYAITKKGLKLIGASESAPTKTIVGSSYLPGGLDAASVATMLKGKWFSGMRWLGSSPIGEHIDLKWVTDDGEIQVQVGFDNGKFEVSLISFPPNEEGRARDVATKLFVKIVNTLYQKKLGSFN
jgi:hypothetical protein